MISVSLAVLAVLLVLGLPVAAVMGALGVFLAVAYSPLPITRAIGELAWTSNTGFLLVSIPLYVMLGEVLLRSGLADRMYGAMSKWLSWMPGGLMHANVGACAMFSATCGSSTATAATVGLVAMPQSYKYGYNERLFLGTIASGGTLGILIPPSIAMIVYGALTNTSIPRLYLAGVIPGLLLALLFIGYIFVACSIRKEWSGQRVSASWRERFASLSDLLPPLIIFAVVVGSIYAGIATATESAALGLMAAIVLAAWHRLITVKLIREVAESSMRTTAMIMLILVAAFFLNWVMGLIGLTSTISRFVNGFDVGPYTLLLIIVVFYVILGTFMEELSMQVMTIPIVAPVMAAAGFDPVWFGIVFVILIQIATISPPTGMTLYIVQGLRPSGSVNDVFLGSLPFVLLMLLLIGMLTLAPGLATWLPDRAFG
jgi:C4-dicarboxylate transporter DctM subunit